MTDSVETSTVHERYKLASRKMGDQLVQKIFTLQRQYWQATALRPDQIVVLAGVGLVAALTAVRPDVTHAWVFERHSGILQAVVLQGCRVIVCEDAELTQYEYRLMVPTLEDMLGRPTSERGTIEPVQL